MVLRVLAGSPFEPLEDISFLHLSLKTVFLLLFASARRCGDIHAIDPRRISITRRSVILVPYPGYLPKISSAAEGEKRFLPIVVRRLSNLSADASELTLCPVRALLHYDAVAKAKSEDRSRFFISTRGDHHPVVKSTLSSWVRRLIRVAYTVASPEIQNLYYHARTHEVRAIASSLALQTNFALNDLLHAAVWANPSTFTDYYLRDISACQAGLHRIAPCIAAGVQIH